MNDDPGQGGSELTAVGTIVIIQRVEGLIVENQRR